MKITDLSQVQSLIRIAMGQPSRVRRAELLKHAFFGAVRVQRQIRDTEMLPEDRARLESFSDALDWSGGPSREGDEADRRMVAFIQNHYPQLAFANDLGSGILEIIGRKRYWREYGFHSHDEWYLALDDEVYCETQVKELEEWEKE